MVHACLCKLPEFVSRYLSYDESSPTPAQKHTFSEIPAPSAHLALQAVLS